MDVNETSQTDNGVLTELRASMRFFLPISLRRLISREVSSSCVCVEVWASDVEAGMVLAKETRSKSELCK